MIDFDAIEFRTELQRLAADPIDRVEAEAFFEANLAAFPNSSRLLTMEADFDTLAGKRVQLEERYHQALQLDPLNVDAYTSLGALNDIEGDLEKAERFFRCAIAAKRQVNGCLGLARVLAQRGRIAEAISELEAVYAFLNTQRQKADECAKELKGEAEFGEFVRDCNREHGD